MTRRKRVLSFLLAMWMLGNLSYEGKMSLNYEIVDTEECFAHYSKGNVYIGKEQDLSKLSNLPENDVLILDDRDSKDPDIKVLSSHLIEDPVSRAEILQIIAAYEEKYPSPWDRTIEAMDVEWCVHNFLYSLNYKQKRTSEVDFNNKDEEIYKNKLLKYIIHN
jgi:hypothetical protein